MPLNTGPRNGATDPPFRRGAARQRLAARFVPAGLAAAALALGLTPLAAAPLSLQPCWLDGIPHEARCGTLPRPLDPARPQGTQIDIHVAVLPALARHKRNDALFFLAGGPGQSAIDVAGPVAQMLGRLAHQRDIVLVDQRGTGRSAPLRCDPPGAFQSLAEQADTRRQVERIRACGRALARLPHGDLRFYTTPLASADADAVRAALGLARINLVGVSYGTRAVLDYLRQFPRHVRRAVLDGVAPPDMALPAAAQADHERAMEALLLACEQEVACARDHPRLRSRWQQLLAAPPREVSALHPLHGREERFTLDRAGLLQLVRTPLYAPALASALPHAIEEAAAGRLTALVGLAAALQAPAGRGIAEGMHFSVVCAEDQPRVPGAGDPAAGGAADGAGPVADIYRQVCADWPRAELPAPFYTVPVAPAPVLLLSGGADPVTPPRHGEGVAQALGAQARHLVVPQAGHGVLALACMRDLVQRFIAAEDADALAVATLPACAAEMPRPPAYAAPRPATP